MHSPRKTPLSSPRGSLRSPGSLAGKKMRQTIAVTIPTAAVKHRSSSSSKVVGIAMDDEASKFPPPSSSTKPADVAMHVIKESYLRNLDVIDKLFDEKKKMEARMKILEEIVEEQGDQLAIVKRNVRGDEIEDDTELTAAEAARRLFATSKDDTHTADSSSRWRRRPSAGRIVTPRGGREDEVAFSSSRPSTAPAAPRRPISSSPVKKRSKPRTAASRPLPASLLADQDRYLHKRLMLAEQERLKKAEEDLYKRTQKERALKVKLSAPKIDGLLSRQKKFEEDKNKRLEKIKRDREEREVKERKERAATMKNELPDKYTVRSWEEISQTADAKRKESIMKRKNALLMQVDAPSCAAVTRRTGDEGDDHGLALAAAGKTTSSKLTPRESPEDVTMRLQIEHAQWKTKIEAARVRVRADAVLNMTRLKASNDTARRMEEREAVLRRRRQERIDNQKRLEEVKEKLYREKQSKRVERLMGQPFPAASRRMTSAAESRLSRSRGAELGRGRLLRSDSDVYGEREEKRVSEKDNFKAEIMSLKVELARNEYRKNLKENKARLRSAVAARPSLIKRHDTEVLMGDLRSDALEKFKSIYKETLRPCDDDESDDDRYESKSKK